MESAGKPEHVIEVNGLVKRYGTLTAVDGVSFYVRPGEIFGMVGPNGAGKTTTIECIEGLREPDQGSITVLSMHPRIDHYALAERIGIQFQSAALPPRIKVAEALDLFASFYHRSVDWSNLLDQVGLSSKENSPFTSLSGGQKQKLFIALALINDPDLVFMDELTTGLDPQSRRAMWDTVKDIRERGTTVFLTTHFMEEAQRLCDRVAIMDHGKIVALDTPSNLIASLKEESRIVFLVDGHLDKDIFSNIPGILRIEQTRDRVLIYGHQERLLGRVVEVLETHKVPFSNLQTEQPDLEDVFLALTGKEMRD